MTYLGLALGFVAVSAAVALVAAAVRRPGRAWWAATAAVAAVLLVLTAVFDSLMIAADLFRYDENALAGVRVWLTPVEDLAWPLAAVLLLPALWELLAPRDAPREPQPDDSLHDDTRHDETRQDETRHDETRHDERTPR
ncbi:lycopene cyclase domain-containing protein [Puerhibacterium sp. TATVAM-FAB25]|uniref:lycopene cyclase domain-containing protein n=1 Tax=Puerhibacterium sp. TATVAM-FAB25 TaxID=3093699 RepID=UPI00397E7A6A